MKICELPKLFTVAALMLFIETANTAAAQSNPPAPANLRIQSLTGTVGIASVRQLTYKPFADKMIEVTTKIDQIISEQGSRVDVIVTPEYLLAPSATDKEYALDAACDASFDNCRLSSAGGTFSTQVLANINAWKARAIASRTYLFIGSMVERFNSSAIPAIGEPYVYFNDLLVISPQGTYSIKRKTGNDWIVDKPLSNCPEPGSTCYNAIDAEALRTVRAFTLTTHEGLFVQVFPIICAERVHLPMVAAAVNRGVKNVGFLIHPEREGDIRYEEMTTAIQSGTWVSTMVGWQWAIRDIFQNNFVKSGIIRQDGFMINSEGGFSKAGMIQLSEPPAPVSDYKLSTSYMFGTFPIVP